MPSSIILAISYLSELDERLWVLNLGLVHLLVFDLPLHWAHSWFERHCLLSRIGGPSAKHYGACFDLIERKGRPHGGLVPLSPLFSPKDQLVVCMMLFFGFLYMWYRLIGYWFITLLTVIGYWNNWRFSLKFNLSIS